MMSKSQKAHDVNTWADVQGLGRPLLILEKQLMDTLELQWRVEQVRIRSSTATATKARSLFEGMAGEVQTFIALIRNRLECWRMKETYRIEVGSHSYWRLFSAEAMEPHDQFEALLSGYAHYARQTSEAITSLRQAGDAEGSRLLTAIFKAAERCLWFLEIYMEGLALKTDSNHLPDWSTGVL